MFSVSFARRTGPARLSVLLGSAALLALTTAAPAFAQSDPTAPTADQHTGDSTSDIVVTGTRRADASLKDSALGIDAFSGQDLERNNVTSLSDLRKLDPSINIQTYGATQTKIVLRGIDSNVGATTSLYLDESAVLGGIGSNILGDGKPGLRLHDIDHVEVLKGPQGTLFGTSSMAGTLRVITKKPDLDNFEGSIDLQGAGVKGGNALYEGSMTINGPLVTDKIGLRVTGWLENGGGYIDHRLNSTTLIDNDNDQLVKGIRAELLFKVTDDFSLLATVTHQDTDVKGTQAYTQAAGPYLNTSPTTEVYHDNYNLYALTGDYDLGFGTIVANGSYSDQNVLNAKDSTPTNISFGVNAPLSFVPRIWFKDYNGELRFASKFSGPLQIVAGGYYEHSDNLYQTNAIQSTADGLPICFSYDECRPFANPGRGKSVYEFGTNSERVISQYAFYGQADYKILPTVTATAGIRYFSADIHDTVTNLQTVFPDFVFGNVTVPSITGNTRGSNHKPSYNFALLWKATPDISFYARAASGFRVGGVNTATSLAAAAGVSFPATYGPDSLWDYEVGVKGYLLDRKVFFELTGYHIDWSNEQLSAIAPGAFAYTINAGKTRSNGVEFSTTVKPVHGLNIAGNVTYVDSKLAEDLPAAVIAAGTYGFKGDRVPLTPKLSWSINAEYQAPVSGNLSAFIDGNVIFHGDSYSTFDNAQNLANKATTFFTYLPSYTLVGAKIGVRSTAGWEFSVFGENLGNAVPYLGVVPSLDGTRIFTARPRTIGARVTAHF
jgi:outer membrane receptor protein involved in Fe transport